MDSKPTIVPSDSIKFLCLARDYDHQSLVSESKLPRDAYNGLVKQTAIASILNRVQYCLDNFNITESKENECLNFQTVLDEICKLPKSLLNEVCFSPSLEYKGPVSLVTLLLEHRDVYSISNIGRPTPSFDGDDFTRWPKHMLQLIKSGLQLTDNLALKIMRIAIERVWLFRIGDMLSILEAIANAGIKITDEPFYGECLNQLELEIKWLVHQEELLFRTMRSQFEDCKNILLQHKQQQKALLLLLSATREGDSQSLVFKDNLPRDLFNLTFKPKFK